MGLTGTYTIPRIVIHPANPDMVYVAASGHEWTNNAERGVYKTTDGGKTWDRVLFVDEKTGAIDLVMDPADPNTLYASTWQRIRLKWNDPRNFPDYAGSGIHKSTDGGKTWAPINKGLPEPRFRGRIGLDVCRSMPNVVYALVDNYELSREPTEEEKADPYGLPSSGFIKGATVYRSDDKGATWTQMSGLTPEQKTFMERHSNTYGWVFGQIRVDPNDANTIYTMGLGLNVSYDGGKTFKRLQTPGGDHHGLWIDPDNSRYLVNVFDQGFAISYDRRRDVEGLAADAPAGAVLQHLVRHGHARSGCMDRCRTTGASAAWWTWAADGTGSSRWTSRARRAARGPPTRSTRSIRTSCIHRGSTERSPAAISPSRAATRCGRRTSSPSASRTRRGSAVSGWRRPSSRRTATRCSITGCSTS